MRQKSMFRKGQHVSFTQHHMGSDLPFVGKVHEIVQIGGDLVLHVEVSHSDGTLWALVREERATLVKDEQVAKRRNKADTSAASQNRCA